MLQPFQPARVGRPAQQPRRSLRCTGVAAHAEPPDPRGILAVVLLQRIHGPVSSPSPVTWRCTSDFAPAKPMGSRHFGRGIRLFGSKDRRLLLRAGDQLGLKPLAWLKAMFAIDDATNQIGAAWAIKELLRQLLAGNGPHCRARTSHRRTAFLTAYVNADLPETNRLLTQRAGTRRGADPRIAAPTVAPATVGPRDLLASTPPQTSAP